MIRNCHFDEAEPIIILEDTRQQTGKHDHIHKWCAKHGIQLMRTKLLCGDYTLPADQSVCIDTKYGLQEVYADLIGKDHARFVRELDAAKACGIKLVILVEERGIHSLEDVQHWENPRITKWKRTPKAMRHPRPPVSSEQLMKTMQTASTRHGCEWQFCARSQTAQRIYDILLGGEKHDG